MRSLGKTTYRKFLCNEMIQHWSELVDESIAAQIQPVTEGKVIGGRLSD